MTTQIENPDNCLLVELKKGKGKSKMVACQTFAEASKLCQIFIAYNLMGGSNWTGGKVYHATKGAFARVSYNGRVWKGTVWNSKDEILNLNTNDY